jgi:gluconate 2-dehydrogenase
MQKILVSSPTFPDVIERLKHYFEVDLNQGDGLTGDELTRRLADKDGALTGSPARRACASSRT